MSREEELQQGPIEENFANQLDISNEEILNKNRNHNAWIVFGRDRWGDLNDGYGKFPFDMGGDKCSTIDIFVGLDSFNAGNEGSNTQARRAKNIQKDASRIYISQKTDIDEAFQLLDIGSLKPSYGKAAIGIKSDNLRFIAREGIKIVANCGEVNTLNEKQSSASQNIYGIELICGIPQNKEDIQPIVKSKNLEGCLKELHNLVDSFIATFNDYVTKQQIFNAAIAYHDHKGAVNAGPTGTIFTVFSNALSTSYESLKTHIEKNMGSNIETHRTGQASKIEEYLTPTHKKYIGSIYNRTN